MNQHKVRKQCVYYVRYYLYVLTATLLKNHLIILATVLAQTNSLRFTSSTTVGDREARTPGVNAAGYIAKSSMQEAGKVRA